MSEPYSYPDHSAVFSCKAFKVTKCLCPFKDGKTEPFIRNVLILVRIRNDLDIQSVVGPALMKLAGGMQKTGPESECGCAACIPQDHPAEVLQAVNKQICANNREEMFVTVWFGILDTETGKITAATAGHEYPAVMQQGGQFALVKDKHGLVIGAMDGIRYKEYELTLTKGSKLFLYTDGVPEATNARNELFGTERMLDALNEEPTASPETILRRVREAVDGFVMEAEQFDDLTMLCVEYKGKDA